MEIPQHTFPGDVRIWNLGDVHRGDDACDVSLYLKAIKEIKESGDCWISTGDLLNVATKDSKTGPYHSRNVQDELEQLELELKPIAHRCLGFVGSNHHSRVEKAVGLSLDKVLAGGLNIPFLGAAGLIKITCGAASYFVALHHGCGGGRTSGAKVNAAQRLEEVFPCADLYIEGHTHSFATWKDERNQIDRKRNRLTPIQVTWSVTGHFLDYFDSYAPGMKLRPKPKGCAVHTLKGLPAGNHARKEVKVEFWQ